MFKRVNRRVKSADFILPAPVGGLNKRDPQSKMSLTDAIEMDNYIPTQNAVELRPGYTLYAPLDELESKSKIETLVAYHSQDIKKMIAVFNNKAYEILPSRTKAFENVSFTKNRCQTVQYQNRLFFMNGVDIPKVYFVDENGVEHFENWSFEGQDLTPVKIINGGVSHEFLWFVEKNSTRAWVSTVAGNVSGTLESFDTAQILKWGGHLISCFNWTVDGGTGIDDYTCLLSSEGEVLIYKGYNPNDASNWTLMGSYKLSKPIGYQCVMQYQGDVVLITQEGYIPLSKALSANNTGFSSVAFSDKISGLVSERARFYKDFEGWQSLIYTKRGYGIFNVPLGEQFEQHVINVATGSWCRFTNIRAFCWCLYDDDLYFGSDDGVYKFDDSNSDNGLPIEGKVAQAYTDLMTSNIKKIVLLNPKIKASKDFKLMVWTNMDYEDKELDYYVEFGQIGGVGEKWNEARWNEAKWKCLKQRKIQSQWVANNAIGYKLSVVFKTKTTNIEVKWYDTGVRFETGTGIL